VLVCLGSACAKGVLHARLLGASRIPVDLKLGISARYLYDLGQLVRVESCVRDLGFAFCFFLYVLGQRVRMESGIRVCSALRAFLWI
jgi:hypothetical protein